MENGWILVGMMGAGKSSLGRAIAQLTGRSFMDTDQLIQNRFCRPISQIFQIYGEDAFREHETSILRDLQPGNHVLATGGGIVLKPENWTEFKRLGTTIYLDAPIELLLSRLAVSKKKRPLLEAEDWEARVHSILQKRIDLYRLADIHVEVGSESIEEVAARVVERIQEH